MAKGFKDSIETIRDNAETIFATPSYVQELKPYQLEELRNYAKTIKRELLKKYGLEYSGITTISEYMNANPFPELEDCEKWNYAERIEAIPGVLRQEDEPKGTGPQISIRSRSQRDFILIIDLMWRKGLFNTQIGRAEQNKLWDTLCPAFGINRGSVDTELTAIYRKIVDSTPYIDKIEPCVLLIELMDTFTLEVKKRIRKADKKKT